MDIIILGINHKTAPVEIREKLAFTAKQLEEAFIYLKSDLNLRECVILSTCNRTEFYAVTSEASKGREAVLSMINELKGIAPGELENCLFFYNCREAVAHLFAVTAGLDSMILGETQIIGQVREAYEKADTAGIIGKVLHALFRQALTCGKRVQTETEINQNAASVSYAAVELAKKIFGRLTNKSVLIIGAGEMSELTLRHVYDQGATDVYVSNRTRERAEKLASCFGGKTWDYDNREECLEKVDIVISSTGAPHFIIKKAEMVRIMRSRKNKPLFMIDIAVPRDFDPEINDINNVYLYDIDDLQGVVASNMKDREKEGRRAEIIVEEETAEFQIWFKTLDVVPLITALRKKAESIRQTELNNSLSSKLGQLDKKQQKAVDNLTKAIINRILREPVLRIKEFAVENKSEAYVASLCQLFDLEGELLEEEAIHLEENIKKWEGLQ